MSTTNPDTVLSERVERDKPQTAQATPVAQPAAPVAAPPAPVKKKKPKKAKKAKKTQPVAAPVAPPVAAAPVPVAPAPAPAPAAPPAKKTRKRRKKNKASTQQPAAPIAAPVAPPAPAPAPVAAPEPQKKGRKSKRQEWRKGRQWPTHQVSLYLVQNGKVNSTFKVGGVDCVIVEGTLIEGWENLNTKKPVALQANLSRFLWHHTIHTKDNGTAPKFSLYMVLGGKALSNFTSQNSQNITVLQNNVPAWTFNTALSNFTILTGTLSLKVEDNAAKDLGKLPKAVSDFLGKFLV